MFATVCLDGPCQPLNMTDKTEFNPPGCSTNCIDRNVIFRAATGHILLFNALPKSRMDIGSWLDVLGGLAGRLAHIRRKALLVAAFVVMPHFSDLRAVTTWWSDTRYHRSAQRHRRCVTLAPAPG